jgi:hypothetical protein
MATKTATKAAAGIQPKGLSVGLVAVTSTYSLNTTFSTGDVIQMVKVPKGGTLIYVSIVGKSTGVGSVIVGDEISTSRYIAATAVSANAVQVVCNSALVPYTYSVDDTIDIVCSASVATVGGAFILTAIFAMDT